MRMFTTNPQPLEKRGSTQGQSCERRWRVHPDAVQDNRQQAPPEPWARVAEGLDEMGHDRHQHADVGGCEVGADHPLFATAPQERLDTPFDPALEIVGVEF
jgi:hypothetical protein